MELSKSNRYAASFIEDRSNETLRSCWTSGAKFAIHWPPNAPSESAGAGDFNPASLCLPRKKNSPAPSTATPVTAVRIVLIHGLPLRTGVCIGGAERPRLSSEESDVDVLDCWREVLIERAERKLRNPPFRCLTSMVGAAAGASTITGRSGRPLGCGIWTVPALM